MPIEVADDRDRYSVRIAKSSPIERPRGYCQGLGSALLAIKASVSLIRRLSFDIDSKPSIESSKEWKIFYGVCTPDDQLAGSII